VERKIVIWVKKNWARMLWFLGIVVAVIVGIFEMFLKFDQSRISKRLKDNKEKLKKNEKKIRQIEVRDAILKERENALDNKEETIERDFNEGVKKAKKKFDLKNEEDKKFFDQLEGNLKSGYRESVSSELGIKITKI